jgi:hypothetical protein
MSALLTIVVTGTIIIALTVNIAAMIGWIRGHHGV